MAVYELGFDDVVQDPVSAYRNFQERISEYGPNAPFPEFKPVVEYLLQRLNDQETQQVLHEHPDLRFEEQEVRNACAHINLTFIYVDSSSYAGLRMYSQPYPYRPTLDTIESLVKFLDKIDRFTNENTRDPFYHFENYAYHRHDLLADPNVILFPVLEKLTYEQLMTMCSVPIGFMGISDKTALLDKSWKSPLDNIYHEFDHTLMHVAAHRRNLHDRGAVSIADQLDIYRENYEFLNNVVIPNVRLKAAGLNDDEVAMRKLVRTMFFELIYERAIDMNGEAIARAILGQDCTLPIEFRSQGTNRVANGNHLLGDVIHFSQQQEIPVLASLYKRLVYGYYDDPQNPNPNQTPLNFRNPEKLAQAGEIVLRLVGYDKDIDLDYLASLANIGAESLGEDVSLPSFEIEGAVPYVTEPISAQSAIEKLKSFDKKVHTLFGFSYLGYQDPQLIMEQIRAELSGLNPQGVIINIGATTDGIGQAYEIAKELGFTTVGVVSTSALSYSHSFSDFVDHVFIIDDPNWGGVKDHHGKYVGTTKVFLEASDSFSAYGGGKNTVATLTEAVALGKSVYYSPAEMDHEIADRELADLGNDVSGKNYLGPMETAWQTLLDVAPKMLRRLSK